MVFSQFYDQMMVPKSTEDILVPWMTDDFTVKLDDEFCNDF